MTKKLKSDSILPVNDSWVVFDKEATIKAPCYITNGVGVFPLSVDLDAYIGIYKVILTIGNLKLAGVPNILIEDENDNEKIALDILKREGHWEHLFIRGRNPEKPYPTIFERQLHCIILGLIKKQSQGCFSIEDLKKAVEKGFDIALDEVFVSDFNREIIYSDTTAKKQKEDFIQSISSTEIDSIEIEWELDDMSKIVLQGNFEWKHKIKSIKAFSKSGREIKTKWN